MSSTTRVVHADPTAVWDVLADGWLYPLWVVGASRMREVDDDWPSVGALLHHSVGAWPALIDDNTEVTECQPSHHLSLRARSWPIGEAAVTIRLRATGGDTEVVIEEDVAAGPGLLVPRSLRTWSLRRRNTETLRRLSYLAERRSSRHSSS